MPAYVASGSGTGVMGRPPVSPPRQRTPGLFVPNLVSTTTCIPGGSAQPPQKEEGDSTVDTVLDTLQTTLDVAGVFPGVGFFPDLISAGISFGRGNWAEGGMSLFAAVPGIGDAGGVGKIVNKIRKPLGKLLGKIPIPSIPKRLTNKIGFLDDAPKRTREILDRLPGKTGKTGPIKEVPDASTLDDLFDSLSSGGKTVAPGTYPGVVKELPDGTIIRRRPDSKSGGATLDITMPDGTIIKVHVKR